MVGVEEGVVVGVTVVALVVRDARRVEARRGWEWLAPMVSTCSGRCFRYGDGRGLCEKRAS